MRTALTGVALIPTQELIEKIVSFRNASSAEITGPLLGSNINFPHVSILQCPFRAGVLNESRLLSIVDQFRSEKGDSMLEGAIGCLYIQPVGWVFAGIDLSGSGLVIQRIALSQLEAGIDDKAIDIQRDMTGYTAQEKLNFQKYGYRYIGNEFKPHITIGRTFNDHQLKILDVTEERFKNSLRGRVIPFRRLVAYRAGEFGSLSEIISEVAI